MKRLAGLRATKRTEVTGRSGRCRRLKQTKQTKRRDEIQLTRLLARLHSNPCFTGTYSEEHGHRTRTHPYLRAFDSNHAVARNAWSPARFEVRAGTPLFRGCRNPTRNDYRK